MATRLNPGGLGQEKHGSRWEGLDDKDCPSGSCLGLLLSPSAVASHMDCPFVSMMFPD